MSFSPLVVPFLLTFFAGISTVVGAYIFIYKAFCQRKYLGFFLGMSAGVMIYLSFIELLPHAIEGLGYLLANLYFFAGIMFMVLIDLFIPHSFLEKRNRRYKHIDNKLYSTGFIIALGLVIHNFPEGMAVFLSSIKDIRLGVILAVAIAIHNIPEGIAVAAPIYHATHDKARAIKYAFVSGMAEPVGAVVAYIFLKPYLSQDLLMAVFAIVAGIMVYISFDELLPTCFNENYGHSSIFGIMAGMSAVFLSLLLL